MAEIYIKFSSARKNPLALQADFFSYIRLTASSIGSASDIRKRVLLGFAQFVGEYNITSAKQKYHCEAISLRRQPEYH